MGRAGGRWKHLTYFGIQKKPRCSCQLSPQKTSFENIQPCHRSVPFAWWNRGNPGIEVPLCGDGLEATPCMSWINERWEAVFRNEVHMSTKRSKNAIIYAAKIIDTNLKSCKMIGRNLVQYLPHTSLHRLCCRSLDSFHQHLDVLTTTFGFNWNLHRFFLLPEVSSQKFKHLSWQQFNISFSIRLNWCIWSF